jgi:hypothetical protein
MSEINKEDSSQSSRSNDSDAISIEIIPEMRSKS